MPDPSTPSSDATLPVSPAVPQAWPSVPGYEVLAELGRGAMGVVYRARQAGLARVVALKMLKDGAQASEVDRGRFRREAEAIARLLHPNIVQIYEVGDWRPPDGGPARAYFAMEFCAKGSLDQRLAAGPLPPDEAARAVATLARAVHAAHQKGLVHRDLKPGNILIGEDGTLKVSDFGLAKQLDLPAAHTASGAILGTPAYMSPEQARGGAVSPATDVYALGAVLYECLTGRPPFRAATVYDTMLQVLSDEPVPPRRLQPRLSRDLETIALKCLEKDPVRRYPTALALAEDLDRSLVGEPILARAIGPFGRLGRWARRNPALASLTAAVALLLVAATAISTTQAVRLDRARTEAEDNAVRLEAALDQRERALVLLRDSLDREKAATRNALDARQEAVARARQATEAEASARAASYTGRVGLAERYWSSNQVGLAQRQLDLCPPQLRHWEWRFLQGLCRAELSSVAGPPGQTSLAALSADGRRVASVCRTSQAFGFNFYRHDVRVWDPDTAAVALTLPFAFRSPRALAVSHDGVLLALSGDDNHIHLYDIDSGSDTPVHTLEGPTRVVSLAFSPEGKLLVSGSPDGTVRHWSLSDESALASTRVADAPVRALAVSAAGQVAAGAEDGTVTLVDAPSARGPATPRKQQRHHRPVQALAYSRDGKRLLSGSADGTARLWDAAGREVRVLTHGGAVTAVAFSPSGDRLVTGGEDRAVVVWDAATGREEFTLRGHPAAIRGLAYHAAGRELAVLDGRGTVKGWDAQTGRLGLRLPGTNPCVALRHDGEQAATADGERVRLFAAGSGAEEGALVVGEGRKVLQVAYSVGGKGLVTFSAFRPAPESAATEVAVWDLQTRRATYRDSAHFLISAGALSSDGRWAAALEGERQVAVWDLWAVPPVRKKWRTKHLLQVYRLAIAADGRLALAGLTQRHAAGDVHAVEVLSGPGGEPAARFAAHEAVQSMAFAPAGRGWLATGGERLVRLWDVGRAAAAAKGPWLAHEARPALRGHTSGVLGLDFSPDGRRLVSVGAELKLWGLPDGEEVLTWPTAGRAVAFDRAGGRLAVVGTADRVHLWDGSPSRGQATLHGDPLALREAGSIFAFVGSAGRLAVAGRDENTTLWDLARIRQVGRLAGPPGVPAVRCLAASRDGKVLAAGAEDGSVRLWDVAGGKALHDVAAHQGPVTAVAFSADGTLVASASADATVKVHDVAGGRLVSTFRGHDDRVLCVAFHEGGRTVASGGEDRKVYLWDAQTGKAAGEGLLHPDAVNAVAFQPGGELVAAGCEDPVIRLWDVKAGKVVRELKGHDDAVRGVAFRPDGKQLASAGWDRTLKVWDVAAGRVLASLSGRGEGLTAVAYSPDGRWLAAADRGLLIQAWDRGE